MVGQILLDTQGRVPYPWLKQNKVLSIQSGRLQEGGELEIDLIQKLRATEDKNEAVGAFLEKRTPVFKGK